MQVLNQSIGQNYAMYQGDSVEVIKGIPDNSIHYSIFSPPFASLYTYSNSDRDMGNSRDNDEFFEHFKYLISELQRVIMPGRLVSVHCMNLPAMKSRDGFIGIKDFRGDIIRAFTNEGFIFHSEVTIWKNPVTEMQRTKALGLLHKQIRKDSTMSRQGIPDYIITFRNVGENPEPIEHTHETFPVDVWQRYASPVWMDIRQSNTLQRKSARDEKDEKHICPLQLDVIERCIDLWTNPNDIVLDPFAGIGSVPYQAVIMGRRGLGIELKDSYYNQALNNLQNADETVSKNGVDTNVRLRCGVCGIKLDSTVCPICGTEV
ncbi:MAG: site-specific DNA-methyltransferase [Ruminococcus flavefaciens]|nr:site-specific DNA-methyltransferase [Ruminococcus flavefaciens]